ncbi:hypothetical protein Acsp04_01760 [Actinomadura sp. NBRC 104425]|uniref:hypothetical protein n=1 Tax=Actinomadura sp. NBRC 104425 TaxID=3032204 RepID=UPI0024A38BAD|nr:hypothetical protein [Actinomadura sp. NBRC 104425]GLZ09941.1 hypothetical protein Acsp04_01760 [Actinomadura sp. NBRC 104425]
MNTSYTDEKNPRPHPEETAPADTAAARSAFARVRTALIWIVLGWTAGLEQLDDNSFLTHLRTGRWILEHHGVPHSDIYSYTVPGADWVAQSWLMEVLYAGLYESVGPNGIRVLGGILGAACAYLAYRLAVRASGGRVRTVVVLVPALFVSTLYWVERPLFAGILAFLALLWIVEIPDSAAGRRPLVALPPLMWLWANCHGSFALGFAYLALHLLGRWADGHRPWQGRERRLLQATVLAFAVCFLNPYGAGLVLFPVELLTHGEALKYVQEWKSPDFRTLTGAAFAVWIAVFAAVLALARKRPTRRDVLVSLPFLLLGLWALRNAAVAPLVGLPIAARLLPEAPPPVRRPRLDVAMIAAVVLLAVPPARSELSRPSFDLSRYPVAAMRTVEQQGLLGRRLFTTTGWAGYVIHRYWPRQRVFMDDRYDMYPTEFAVNFQKVRYGDARWQTTFDRYRVEVVVWETGTALTEILTQSPSWRVLYRDRLATVLVRR